MTDLEYLIIYTNEGIPIYSRCFANICKISMNDETLFSAFLACLNQFAGQQEIIPPESMELEGEQIKVSYSSKNRLNSIAMRDLILRFYYVDFDNITVAAGFSSPVGNINNIDPHLFDFMQDIEGFLKESSHSKWNIFGINEYLEFEKRLLQEVIYPFLDTQKSKDKCAMKENCPYRLALYEGEGISIFDKLRHKVSEIANSSILNKLRLVMFSSKYSLS